MTIINKNVPIITTPRKRGKKDPKNIFRKYPFNEMKVGDSFLCNGLNQASVRVAACSYARNHNCRFTVRKTAEGYRCWRIS